MARYTVAEIFGKVGVAPTREEKVAVLRQNDDPGVRAMLKVAFDPGYEWDLPEGTPPFKVDRDLPIGFASNNLRGNARLFYIFEKKYTNVKRVRKEMLFINLLEGLHHSEADLVVAIKDGQLPKLYPGLDDSLVREVYPGLLAEPKRG
jgi:Family of unknown function (DUF6433)